MYSHGVLDAIIVREGMELQLKVPTVPADDVETDHVISFCGADLHVPHHAATSRWRTDHATDRASLRKVLPLNLNSIKQRLLLSLYS